MSRMGNVADLSCTRVFCFIIGVLQYAYMATVQEVIKCILHVVLTGEVKVGHTGAVRVV